MSSTKKTIQPLPFFVYFLCAAVIALIGFASSIYLSISHYRVYTDIGYKSFCAVSKAINCDTVSQSPYSIFLNVPVPVWGVFGYGIVLILLIKAWSCRRGKKNIWPTLFFILLIYSVLSIVLALISSMIIKSYCIMCILTYAVNFALLFLSWLIFKRFENETLLQGLKRDIGLYLKNRYFTYPVIFISIAVVSGLLMLFPEYWNMKVTTLTDDVPNGITEDGHPWIGAMNPELTIVEFTDYQCFQCKKMHFFLRQLISKYPGKIRLVHRHFPMDNTVNPGLKKNLHVGSGKMALLAIYASAKEKFWEMNDLLYEIAGRQDNFNLSEIAEKTGISQAELAWALTNRDVYRRLAMDLKAGGELGLEGTPGFVIDGKVYQGNIPPDVLQRIFFR